MQRLLEICVESPEDARVAAEAGADRVELASALDLGGLTPSIGLVEETVARCAAPVVVLLRPRPGGFRFREDEIACMVRDAARLATTGVQGLVVGALDEQHLPEVATLARLKEAAPGLDLVFHRAFDQCPDPQAGLLRLRDLGFARILTAGGAGRARDHIEALAALTASSRRLEGPTIMAGGGLDPVDLPRLESQAGVREFHTSANRVVREDGPATRASLATRVRLGPGEHRQVSAPLIARLRDTGWQ